MLLMIVMAIQSKCLALGSSLELVKAGYGEKIDSGEDDKFLRTRGFVRVCAQESELEIPIVFQSK